MFARAGATKWDSTRIFLNKYITGPKYTYWKCRYRGGDHMAHQSKTPLKLHQSGSDFHRNSVHITHWYCIGLTYSGNQLKISIFRGLGPGSAPSQIRKYQVYPNTTNLKLFFNFAYVLTIIEDILGPFGALHLWNKLFHPYSAVKMVKNTCKLHQTSTKYWSIIAEIWPEYKVAHTKSDWTGFKITSDITVPIV